MAHEKLKSKAQAVGLDWALVQHLIDTYGPALAALVMELVSRWKQQGPPRAAFHSTHEGVLHECPPDLADVLREAHDSAMKTVCATCCALVAAGLDDDHDDEAQKGKPKGSQQSQQQAPQQHPTTPPQPPGKGKP